MTTVEGVRAEERWGAGGAEDDEGYIKEEYRARDGRSRRDVYRGRDDRSRREDHYRGRDRAAGEGEKQLRSRGDGEDRPRKGGEERARRNGDDRVRGDDDRRERGDGQERRRRAEDESPERERVVVPERAPLVEKPSGRSGGVYIPPFKLAQMMKDVDDKSSVAYQRMTWDALRKSINGLVNKVCVRCVVCFFR